jgi:predicted Zn finger-like uncharacterized protein
VQAQCPQCAQRIVVDDAKVPDKPFAVKCPKCQTIVRLPGKAAVPSPPPEPALSFEEAAPPPPLASAQSFTPAAVEASSVQDEVRAQMAQLRREMSAPGAEAPSHERALVAIPDRAQAAAITLVLTRLGYGVDSVEEHEDAARFVEQGVYALAATSRAGAGPGRGESLYQRINRLSPEQRRQLFVILVGDEFKSADGLQGFAVMADLVLHTRDLTGADSVIRSALHDRRRLYQVFNDARRRYEATAG